MYRPAGVEGATFLLPAGTRGRPPCPPGLEPGGRPCTADKADALMHALRHLIGRAGPTPMEVGILEGVARQIRWHVAQNGDEGDRV